MMIRSSGSEGDGEGEETAGPYSSDDDLRQSHVGLLSWSGDFKAFRHLRAHYRRSREPWNGTRMRKIDDDDEDDDDTSLHLLNQPATRRLILKD
jgi:hypothetical protein